MTAKNVEPAQQKASTPKVEEDFDHDRIKEKEMGPFYEIVCQETNTPVDQSLLSSLKEKNAIKLQEIDNKIKDAEQNLGESDVRRAWLSKSEYLSQIGNKEAAVEAFHHTFNKTVGIGYRIDLVLNLIRLGLFFMDNALISANISKAKDLTELSSPRCFLTSGGKNGELVSVREFLNALYNCEYDKFYKLLTELEVKRLKLDRYLEPHQQFYTEAMRLKAYKQFLTPYKINMAESFGVTKEFIDNDLHAQVSSGRLNCRIDAVNEVIEMRHTDSLNDLYKTVIRDGDNLLNRVEKLARDIDA
ncbi:26S proteasome subunit RPN7 domain-containing protein [Ditylenchus destructor]|nr:26S proteasome subunit RPN7 domain-containing protein [Ditylenchus destructor]